LTWRFRCVPGLAGLTGMVEDRSAATGDGETKLIECESE
jgi:hypothetical protein